MRCVWCAAPRPARERHPTGPTHDKSAGQKKQPPPRPHHKLALFSRPLPGLPFGPRPFLGVVWFVVFVGKMGQGGGCFPLKWTPTFHVTRAILGTMRGLPMAIREGMSTACVFRPSLVDGVVRNLGKGASATKNGVVLHQVFAAPREEALMCVCVCVCGEGGTWMHCTNTTCRLTIAFTSTLHRKATRRGKAQTTRLPPRPLFPSFICPGAGPSSHTHTTTPSSHTHLCQQHAPSPSSSFFSSF